MDSRANSMEFRSVPLIQRRNLTSPDGEASRGETRSDARRSSSAESERSGRSTSRAADSEHDAQHESTSAHVGESGVVRVSRRSERSSAAGGPGRLRLVPDEASHEERDGASDRSAGRRRDREASSSRRDRTRERGDVSDVDDRLEAATIPGSRSRRAAVRNGIMVVPNSLSQLLAAAMSHARALTALAVAVLVAFMLFAPVRDLYVAHRQLDRLQATYDALAEENDVLSNDLEVLQSREGIENEARERGYVEVGETKVVVNGLEGEQRGGDQSAIGLSDVEVHEDIPWYISLLDKVFGYDPEA